MPNGDPILKDADRQKLDGIVQKMIANHESDDNIRLVVNDFKTKYGTSKKKELAGEAKVSFGGSATSAPPVEKKSISSSHASELQLPQGLSISDANRVRSSQTNLPQQIDKEAAEKVNNMTGLEWNDPLSHIYGSYMKPDNTPHDKAVTMRAAKLVERQMLDDGYTAKQILDKTHFGGKDNSNFTSRELRNRAETYDKNTNHIRQIKVGAGNPESQYYFDWMQDAAIKWYATKNKNFEKELATVAPDLVDPINAPDVAKRIDSGKRGQILNEFLSQKDIITYLQKENPELIPVYQYTAKNNINFNKDFGINVVANEVSQAIEKSGYNRIEPIFNYWGKNSQEYANLVAEQLYKDDPDKMKIYNENIRNNQHKYLDAPSLLEGVAEGIKDVGHGIQTTFTQPFSSASETTKQKWIEEASNVTADPKGLMEFLQNTGKATGFVMALAAGGEVLEGTTGLSPRMAQKVLIGSTMFGDNLQMAERKYENPALAWTDAAINTGMFVALSDIFPAAKAKAAFTEIKPEVSQMIENLTRGKINQEMARQQANTLMSQAIDVGSKALKQNTRISLDMTGIAAVNQVLDKVFGLSDQEFNKYHPDGELSEQFKSMFLSNGLVAGLSGYGEMRKTNKMFESSVYSMASNPLRTIRMIDDVATKNPEVKTGEMLDNLKFLVEEKRFLDNSSNPKTGQPYSDKEKRQYLSSALKAKVLQAQMDASPEGSGHYRTHPEDIRFHEKVKDNIIKGKEHDEEINAELNPQTANKVEAAVIEVGGKVYEGKNHAEAILAAEKDGVDISKIDRTKEGKFRLSDGTIIDREEAQKRFGKDRSEMLIQQDDASLQADREYQDIKDAKENLKDASSDLFFLAKQKYGLADDGTEHKPQTVKDESGKEKVIPAERDIAAQHGEEVDKAVTEKFPDKQSVIDEINRTRQAPKQFEKGDVVENAEGKKFEVVETEPHLFKDVETGEVSQRPTEEMNKVEKPADTTGAAAKPDGQKAFESIKKTGDPIKDAHALAKEMGATITKPEKDPYDKSMMSEVMAPDGKMWETGETSFVVRWYPEQDPLDKQKVFADVIDRMKSSGFVPFEEGGAETTGASAKPEAENIPQKKEENIPQKKEENIPSEKSEPKTIAEHDLKVGDKIKGKIYDKEVSGTVTGVGEHRGQIVIDFVDSEGNDRFMYAKQITDLEHAKELPATEEPTGAFTKMLESELTLPDETTKEPTKVDEPVKAEDTKPAEAKPDQAGEPTKKEQFNTKVDSAAGKIKDLLKKLPHAKLPDGTETAGATLDQLVDAAANIVKKAYGLKEDIGAAIDKGIQHLKNEWREAWGNFEDLEPAIRELLGESLAEPPPPPPKEYRTPESPKQEWTSIRKEKLKEVESVAKMYQQGGTREWTEMEEEALSDLQNRYPDKSLYDASRDQVYRMAQMYDNQVDFNPTTKDLVVVQYFLAEVNDRLNKVEGWNSADALERVSALAQWEKINEDMVAAAKALNPAEAGRAFGYRQSEAMLDPDAGLKLRRMEVMSAKDGEQLSDEELDWTADLWQREKDLMQREHETRIRGMQEAFDRRIADLQKNYQSQAEKSSKGTTHARVSKDVRHEKMLGERGKDLAERLRSGKLKGGAYSTIPGFPQAINLVIEAIAQIVEKGATLAEAIQRYAADNKISDVEQFKRNFFDAFDRREKGNAAYEKMSDIAKVENLTNITTDIVAAGHVKDFVNAHIGEFETEKILGEATKSLKTIFPDIKEEDVRDAYIKKGKYNIPTEEKIKSDVKQKEQSLGKIAKLEKDLDDLNQKKNIERSSKAKAQEIDKEVAAKKRALKEEMIKQGVKFSGEDKYTKASYETRAQSNNQRISDLQKRVTQKINEGGLSGEEINKLAKLNAQLESAKIKLDPNSALSQKAVMDQAPVVLKNTLRDFGNELKGSEKATLGEFRRGIQNTIDKFSTDKDDAEQDVKLARAKNSLQRQIDEGNRRLNAGEYDEPDRGKPLLKTDAELVKLRTELNKIKSEFDKKKDEVERANKGKSYKYLELLRGMNVAFLIYRIGTFTKVAASAALRMNFEAASKATTGKLAASILPGLSVPAKRGGESSSLLSIKQSYQAAFIAKGEKGIQDMYDKANQKYEDALNNFNNALATGADDKTLIKLKNEKDKALLSAMANMAYNYIGSNSYKDMWDALMHRSNMIERQFGHFSSENITFSGPDRSDWIDMVNYATGLFGRSHSALKTLSARASYAAGFVARLEGALKDGKDITNPETLLVLANESYLDWDRGKYQQSNFVSDAFSGVTRFFEQKSNDPKYGNFYKALATGLNLDVAIRRVPVNLLIEGIGEYGFGAFRAAYYTAREYVKGAKNARLSDEYNIGEKTFKEALHEQMKNVDPDRAAMILRCFRKGGFGLGLFALVSTLGVLHFGGLYHKGQKKKTEEELAEGELNPGELMVGDKKMGHNMSSLLEHITPMMPVFYGMDWARIKRDEINKGRSTVKGVYDATWGMLEAIQNAVPQSEYIKPLDLTMKVEKNFEKAVSDLVYSNSDVDADGKLIPRKPMDVKDRLNMFIGRKEVLTAENYRAATQIIDNYGLQIKYDYENNGGRGVEELKKERDAQIEEIYRLNAEGQLNVKRGN